LLFGLCGGRERRIDNLIYNRPSNLWLAAAVAVFNVLAYAIHLDAEIVILVNVALAAVIGLVAGQPPVVTTNDSVTVKTNNGHTDKRITFDESGEAITTAIPGTSHLQE
jgi:hypothetical protein